jgi:5,6-dimethylbenzimidazole synthase
MSVAKHRFDDAAREAVYRAINARRDVRHFIDAPLEAGLLQRLLAAAHAAPSVGLSQPWAFIHITDAALRLQIHTLVEAERRRTAAALGEREDEFLRLKVEGVRECAELLVVAVRDGGTSEVFGRRTLPQMSLASAACAIQNLWLAARAEGVGMGWVSMFEPEALAALLALPNDLGPIAVLCLGATDEFRDQPQLQIDGWRAPRPLSDFVHENRWSEP